MSMSLGQNGQHLTLVLIGSLGSGKSSTGNSIIGEKVFKVSIGTKPVTTDIEQASGNCGEHSITVFDTPGLRRASDFSHIKDTVNSRLKATGQVQNAVYLITIQIGRYTQEERCLLEEIFKRNKDILRKSVVVFTNKDELSDDEGERDQAVKSWVEENPSLTKLVKTYQLKYVAFQNKRCLQEENELQVKRLISVVLGMDEGDAICPTVSAIKKQKTNRIYVDRETLGRYFGYYGAIFYDQQEKLQQQLFH